MQLRGDWADPASIMGKSLEQFSKYVSVKTHRITMEVLKAGGTTARQIMRFVLPIPV